MWPLVPHIHTYSNYFERYYCGTLVFCSGMFMFNTFNIVNGVMNSTPPADLPDNVNNEENSTTSDHVVQPPTGLSAEDLHCQCWFVRSYLRQLLYYN